MELTNADKVYGLSLIWKEAEYNFPFWSKLPDLDWDRAYQDALPKVIAAKDVREYYLELMRFITLLKDGHTMVMPFQGNTPYSAFEAYGYLPIKIGYIDQRYYVTDVESGLDIQPYSEIIEINGLSMEDYLSENVWPFVWHEKKDSMTWVISQCMPFIEHGNVISIKTASGSCSFTAKRQPISWVLGSNELRSHEPLHEIFTSGSLSVHKTGDDLCIIRIPTFMNSALVDVFFGMLEQIKDCKGFVIDVRENGGGNSNYGDGVAQAFIKGAFRRERSKHLVHIGVYKSWGKWLDYDNIDLSDPWVKKAHDICKRQYFEESNDAVGNADCPMTLDQPVVLLISAGHVQRRRISSCALTT